MCLFKKISDQQALEEFLREYGRGPIFLECILSSEGSSPYSFRSHEADFKIAEYVYFPYNCPFDRSFIKLFDVISNGLHVIFQVSPNHLEYLRSTERIISMLYIHKKGRDFASSRLDRSLVEDSVGRLPEFATLQVPCVIGLTKRFKSETQEKHEKVAWSYFWQIDEAQRDNYLKCNLIEKTKTWKIKLPNSYLQLIYKQLQPTLWDNTSGNSERSCVERQEAFLQKVNNKLSKYVNKVKTKQTKTDEEEKYLLSDFFSRKLSELPVGKLTSSPDLFLIPHESMLDKAKNDIQSSITILECDYNGLPTAFRIQFGDGFVSVIPNGCQDLIAQSYSKEQPIKNTSQVNKVVIDIYRKNGEFMHASRHGDKKFPEHKALRHKINFYRFLFLYMCCREYGAVSFAPSGNKDTSIPVEEKVMCCERGEELIKPVGAEIMYSSDSNMHTAIIDLLNLLLFEKKNGDGQTHKLASDKKDMRSRIAIITRPDKSDPENALTYYIAKNKLRQLAFSPDLFICMSTNDYQALKAQGFPGQPNSSNPNASNEQNKKFFELLEKHIEFRDETMSTQ